MDFKIFREIIIIILCSLFFCSCQNKRSGLDFSMQYSPLEVGKKVAERYLEQPFRDYESLEAITPTQIIYPEVCTWLGALRFAAVSGDKELASKLEKRYAYLISERRELVPIPNHVDNTVFGCIPLELYRQTNEVGYYHTGLDYANIQWEVPLDTILPDTVLSMVDDGLSWQTRFWIDDMYMISILQLEAYLASKDVRYLNRAANEMIIYLDSIQQPNGLFYHAGDVPFFWGRGNGWMAAGMAELLKCLPKDNIHYARILQQYLKMMNTLKGYQRPDGLWGQLVDDSESWSETSGSGMFVYAMIIGVKYGWLDEAQYTPVIEKGWQALVKQVSLNGDVLGVCQATNKKNDRQYYLDRKCYPGDLHGQAVILWCATALLEAGR